MNTCFSSCCFHSGRCLQYSWNEVGLGLLNLANCEFTWIVNLLCWTKTRCASLGDDKLGNLFHWKWKRLGGLFFYINMSCSRDILREVLGIRLIDLCGLVYRGVGSICQG